MKARLWLLQDPNSPKMKVWGVIQGRERYANGTLTKVFYGGPAGGGRPVVSTTDIGKAMATLRKKAPYYPLRWDRDIEVPEPLSQGASHLDLLMDSAIKNVYGNFVRHGGSDCGIDALLDQWKLVGRVPVPAEVDQGKDLTGLLQSIPASLGWNW